MHISLLKNPYRGTHVSNKIFVSEFKICKVYKCVKNSCFRAGLVSLAATTSRFIMFKKLPRSLWATSTTTGSRMSKESLANMQSSHPHAARHPVKHRKTIKHGHLSSILGCVLTLSSPGWNS